GDCYRFWRESEPVLGHVSRSSEVPYSDVLRARWHRALRTGGLAIDTEAHFHHSADLELHGPLLRDLDALQGLRVLSGAGLANLALKNAEVPEFQPVSMTEFIDNIIQKL